MNYDQALTIAAQNAPNLLVDPAHKELTSMFVVRATKTGTPFSIHLPTSINPDHTPAEALAQETEIFIDALKAAQTTLGTTAS